MRVFVFVLISLSTLKGFAQTKKDNVVIITTPTGVTIEQIKTELFNRGYTINKSDSSYIATDEIASGTYNYSLKIAVMKSGQTIKFMGWLSSGQLFKNERVYYGFKGTIFRKAFEEIQSLAKSFSPNATYLTQ